jgi:septal ring factor EnvC (AmiA/AmiB activator)
MSDHEPLPCPFCGAKADTDVVGPNERIYFCSGACGARHVDEMDLAEWNARPTETSLRARIAELEAAARDDADYVVTLKTERETLRAACNDHQIREVQANSRADYLQKQLDAAKARIAILEEALDAEARISKRLEEALRWYADDSEFPDGGVRARAALNPPKEEP